MQVAKSPEQLQESLRQVTELLERHRVLEALTERQEGAHEKREVLQALAHRQNLADLAHRVRQLHPADLAFILESLPIDDRRLVWAELSAAQAALVLLEVQRPVQE